MKKQTPETFIQAQSVYNRKSIFIKNVRDKYLLLKFIDKKKLKELVLFIESLGHIDCWLRVNCAYGVPSLGHIGRMCPLFPH